MKGQTLQEWAGTTRIFALVFTDIVDSTTLANELHDEKWIDVLLKHFTQARGLMESYDHHEIKIIGDSFMVVFRDVLDAPRLYVESKRGHRGRPNKNQGRHPRRIRPDYRRRYIWNYG